MLALGDSYTIGTGGPIERSFPAQLVARWHARGMEGELRNLGVNGYTTDDLALDELPHVREYAPRVTTLLIGANDVVASRSASTYRARLDTILDRLVADGIEPARLVVISSPDWSRTPGGAFFGEPGAIARLVDAYASVAREEAARVGARFFDIVPLGRREADARSLAPDGLHFSGEAYAEWAVALDSAMAEWGLP